MTMTTSRARKLIKEADYLARQQAQARHLASHLCRAGWCSWRNLDAVTIDILDGLTTAPAGPHVPVCTSERTTGRSGSIVTSRCIMTAGHDGACVWEE